MDGWYAITYRKLITYTWHLDGQTNMLIPKKDEAKKAESLYLSVGEGGSSAFFSANSLVSDRLNKQNTANVIVRCMYICTCVCTCIGAYTQTSAR